MSGGNAPGHCTGAMPPRGEMPGDKARVQCPGTTPEGKMPGGHRRGSMPSDNAGRRYIPEESNDKGYCRG